MKSSLQRGICTILPQTFKSDRKAKKNDVSLRGESTWLIKYDSHRASKMKERCSSKLGKVYKSGDVPEHVFQSPKWETLIEIEIECNVCLKCGRVVKISLYRDKLCLSTV